MTRVQHIPAFFVVVLLAVHTQAQGEATKLPLLYKAPGQAKVKARRDIIYHRAEGNDLLMDVYTPANVARGTALPAVIHISGSGRTKNWRIFEDYGAATAAHGMVGIEFNKRYSRAEGGAPTALADIAELLKFVRQNAARFQIDPNRICLWVFSGGGLLLSAGMQPEQPFIRCLVSFYGFHDDRVRQQLKAVAGKLPPLLMVRAGLDTPDLNSNFNAFVSDALNQNERLELINYSDGRHAFDIYHNTPRTRQIIRRTFQFIAEQMSDG
jgi:acetyl esterase/lipase